MRAFTDGEGQSWEVALGRESWGVIVALFIPRSSGEDVRQAPLRASSYEEANAELEGLDVAALRELLARSTPKEVG